MRRLVFTFGWEKGGFPVPLGSSTVTIELVSSGDVTRVSVRHAGLTETMATSTPTGWAMFLDLLARGAEHERAT